MLNKSITYRLLLRVAGILLLLWTLYMVFQIATEPVHEIFSGGVSDTRLLIQISVGVTIFNILYAGVLFLAAAGVLLLGFSFRHPRVAYWCIQVALWFAGISLWYKFSQFFDPLPQDPLWLIITVICSFLLLALYKPVMGLISKLVLPKRKRPTIRPKNEPTSSSLYEQPQVMYPKQD